MYILHLALKTADIGRRPLGARSLPPPPAACTVDGGGVVDCSAGGISRSRRLQRRVRHREVVGLLVRLRRTARRSLRILDAARSLLRPPSSGHRPVVRTGRLDRFQVRRLGPVRRVPRQILLRQGSVDRHSLIINRHRPTQYNSTVDGSSCIAPV